MVTDVMVNGLPGKMATIIAQEIIDQPEKYDISTMALTGPNQPEAVFFKDKKGKNKTVNITHKEQKGTLQLHAPTDKRTVYVVEACKGEGVADKNAAMYCENNIPFVMLSTGAQDDYANIRKLAEESKTPCVAYPNMDVRLIAWMAGIRHMAKEYPGAFETSLIQLSETHQADKVNSNGEPETSGTMKKMLSDLSSLAKREIAIGDVLSVRGQLQQTDLFRVPEEWLGWHAYHVFKIANKHDGVDDSEELIFKRHGGDSYKQGAMKALDFLIQGKNTKYFNTMDDVLKDGN
ncbi:hypothetical protein ACFLZ7_02005 [Nanoarchaeota archaeon]